VKRPGGPVADASHRVVCLLNDVCRRQNERIRSDIKVARALAKQAIATAGRK
jgi:hypothetical protein